MANFEREFNLIHSSENKYVGSPIYERESPDGEEKRLQILQTASLFPDLYRVMWSSNLNLKYITDNEATHRALERVYNGPIRYAGEDVKNFSEAEFFIRNLHTGMGARNRFRIVQETCRQEISRHFSEDAQKFNLLSIASGSSRAIMEGIAKLHPSEKNSIDLRLVDIEKDAIEDGKNLAAELGISDQVAFRRTNFLRFDHYLESGYEPQFTEIVGLFDYVPDKVVIRMLEKLKERMPCHGSVLYSSVVSNDEEDFLHEIIGWRPMIYRSGEEMVKLALEAGFNADKIELIEEPLKMCNLILARK